MSKSHFQELMAVLKQALSKNSSNYQHTYLKELQQLAHIFDWTSTSNLKDTYASPRVEPSRSENTTSPKQVKQTKFIHHKRTEANSLIIEAIVIPNSNDVQHITSLTAFIVSNDKHLNARR